MFHNNIIFVYYHTRHHYLNEISIVFFYYTPIRDIGLEKINKILENHIPFHNIQNIVYRLYKICKNKFS